MMMMCFDACPMNSLLWPDDRLITGMTHHILVINEILLMKPVRDIKKDTMFLRNRFSMHYISLNAYLVPARKLLFFKVFDKKTSKTRLSKH